MPAFDDHPVTLILRRYNVPQSHLAETAAVNRSTIDQIVQGRVRKVNKDVLNVLTSISFIPQAEIQRRVDEWYDKPQPVSFNRREEAVLSLEPEDLHKYYRKFEDWRAEFAPASSAFASRLRINRLTVRKYEQGKFVGGMPPTLHHAIVVTFMVSDDYVTALGRLPGNPC